MDKKALLEQFKAEVEASGTSVNHILKMCEFNEVSNDFSSDTIHDYSVGCLNGAWWMYQRQQAKVEELQNDVSVMLASHKRMSVGLLQQQDKIEKLTKERDELQTLYTQQGINMFKLQKRVDYLELKLKEIANIAMRARRGEYWTESGRNAGLNIAAQIEQALKGEG
ncbi:TPA: hypothetical protein ACF2EA_000237 [Acinetobacter baumannii]